MDTKEVTANIKSSLILVRTYTMISSRTRFVHSSCQIFSTVKGTQACNQHQLEIHRNRKFFLNFFLSSVFLLQGYQCETSLELKFE